MYVMKIAHTVQYHEHRSSFQNIFYKYRDLKCFTEDAVLIYSGMEFQIEVPETMNELQNNSVLGLGV